MVTLTLFTRSLLWLKLLKKPKLAFVYAIFLIAGWSFSGLDGYGDGGGGEETSVFSQKQFLLFLKSFLKKMILKKATDDSISMKNYPPCMQVVNWTDENDWPRSHSQGCEPQQKLVPMKHPIWSYLYTCIYISRLISTDIF